MDTLWRTTFAFRYRSEYGGIGVPYPLDVLANVGVFALPQISYFGGRIGFAIAPVFAIDPPGIRIVSVSILDHYLALLEVRRSMHSGSGQMGECLWECADLFVYPQYCVPQ